MVQKCTTPNSAINPKLSIIIPSYNERENIKYLIPKLKNILKKSRIENEIIIVDDNSPDGTGLLVKKLAKRYKKLQVLQRKEKLGLASAVLDGFKITHGDILGVMDADLSHPPEAIPQLLQPIKRVDADFVIGSRYTTNGKIKGWDLKRKFISKGASLLAKILTRVKDPLSGFFFIKKGAIERIKFNPHGYKIVLEFIIKANYKKLVEVPYTFTNKKNGKSKLNFQECVNYLHHCLDLFSYKNPTMTQFIKFCIVGGFGSLINLAVLYVLVEFFNVWYMFSAALAFVAAVTNNFVLNKFWTFRSYSKKKDIILTQYTKFFTISIIALCINLLIVYTLVEYFHLWYILSQFLAILIAMGINFIGNGIWTFSRRK